MNISTDVLHTELIGHSHSVTGVSFFPDGNSIVSSSKDDTLKIWNVADGNNTSTLRHLRHGVLSCDVSHDGKIIASGGGDGALEYWDPSTGKATKGIHPCKDLSYGQELAVIYVSFSTPSTFLICISSGGTIRVYNTEEAKVLQSLGNHTKDFVSHGHFSPDSSMVLYCYGQNLLKMWDWQNNKRVFSVEDVSPFINWSSFSPDGKLFLTGSVDKRLRLYDSKNGNLLQTWAGHSATVSSFAFSPDGETVVSASDDKQLKFWNIKTGTEMKSIQGHNERVNSLKFSPDGKKFVTASIDKTLRIWTI